MTEPYQTALERLAGRRAADAAVEDGARCPDCGGPVRRAFAQSDCYVSCRRCGHVHLVVPGTDRLLRD